MLVRCPNCRTKFRLVDYPTDERTIRYLCPGCEQIVRLDLERDEVRTSSSSGSFRRIRRRKVVLVADDAPEVLQKAERILEEGGYQVLLAGDGADALEQIREAHPDLVVLDLLMHEKTGFDVLRELRKDPDLGDTPVLAMSEAYRNHVMEFLQRLGASGFLDKDQLETELLFRVQGLVGEAS